MDADRFVRELWACAPPVAALEQTGMSARQAESFREAYCARPKAGPSFDDPVLDLISRYDLSNVELGLMHLLPEPIDHGEHIQVGVDEVEPLMIHRPTGEIRVIEAGTGEHIIAECAAGSSQFLDAILRLVCFRARCVYEEGLYEEQAEACRVAVEAAQLAGGDKYLPFCRDFAGCYTGGIQAGSQADTVWRAGLIE